MNIITITAAILHVFAWGHNAVYTMTVSPSGKQQMELQSWFQWQRSFQYAPNLPLTLILNLTEIHLCLQYIL